MHGTVVAGAGFCAVSQPVVRHGQKEEVECVKLALAGSPGFFPGL